MNFFNSRQPIYQPPDNPLYPQPNNHESRINALESQIEALQQQINSLQSQLTNLSGTVGGKIKPSLGVPVSEDIYKMVEQEKLAKKVQQEMERERMWRDFNHNSHF